jgi:hypothetical protein
MRGLEIGDTPIVTAISKTFVDTQIVYRWLAVPSIF